MLCKMYSRLFGEDNGKGAIANYNIYYFRSIREGGVEEVGKDEKERRPDN